MPTAWMRRPAFLLLLCALLLPPIANGENRPSRLPERLHGEQLERFCEEERKFTEPWIDWASNNRTLCHIQSKTPLERSACLESIGRQLEALHQEHRDTYLSQMRALQPDHPVMQGILSRLQEHRRFAFLALEEDLQPSELSARRKESCLRQR